MQRRKNIQTFEKLLHNIDPKLTLKNVSLGKGLCSRKTLLAAIDLTSVDKKNLAGIEDKLKYLGSEKNLSQQDSVSEINEKVDSKYSSETCLKIVNLLKKNNIKSSNPHMVEARFGTFDLSLVLKHFQLPERSKGNTAIVIYIRELKNMSYEETKKIGADVFLRKLQELGKK